jgi:hypothetical protein
MDIKEPPGTPVLAIASLPLARLADSLGPPRLLALTYAAPPLDTRSVDDGGGA